MGDEQEDCTLQAKDLEQIHRDLVEAAIGIGQGKEDLQISREGFPPVYRKCSDVIADAAGLPVLTCGATGKLLWPARFIICHSFPTQDWTVLEHQNKLVNIPGDKAGRGVKIFPGSHALRLEGFCNTKGQIGLFRGRVTFKKRKGPQDWEMPKDICVMCYKLLVFDSSDDAFVWPLNQVREDRKQEYNLLLLTVSRKVVREQTKQKIQDVEICQLVPTPTDMIPILDVDVPIQGKQNRTMLFYAAQSTDDWNKALARAKHLIRLRADVNKPTLIGMTPLMAAAKQANVEMVKLLLWHGADPCMKTRVPGRFAAIHYASRVGNREIFELLWNHPKALESESTNKPLAAKKVLDQCLVHCSPPTHCDSGEHRCWNRLVWDKLDHKDRLKLQEAVQDDNREEVQRILHRAPQTVNLPLEQREGKLAIHIAAENNLAEMLDLLLRQHKANVNATTIVGCSALLLAVRSGGKEALRRLIEFSADVNQENGWNELPLHYASFNNDELAFKLLLPLTETTKRQPVNVKFQPCVRESSLGAEDSLNMHGDAGQGDGVGFLHFPFRYQSWRIKVWATQAPGQVCRPEDKVHVCMNRLFYQHSAETDTLRAENAALEKELELLRQRLQGLGAAGNVSSPEEGQHSLVDHDPGHHLLLPVLQQREELHHSLSQEGAGMQEPAFAEVHAGESDEMGLDHVRKRPRSGSESVDLSGLWPASEQVEEHQFWGCLLPGEPR